MSKPEPAHHDPDFSSALRTRVGPEGWKKWFSAVRHEVVEETLYLVAPSDFHIRWLRNNYQTTIDEVAASTFGPLTVIEYLVTDRPDLAEEPSPVPDPLGGPVPEGPPGTRPPRGAGARGRPPAPRRSQAPVHPPKFLSKYVFDTFVAGQSNQLALAAAKRVSEGPGQNYNPLFIYGGAGLGKTHLLHAIGHYIRSNRPTATVRYMTSENFFNEFVDGIRNKRMDSFKDRYRTIDVLLLDDIQFFEGKEQVLEEVFHTFNTLHERDHQMVLSCDRPPKDLGIEDRLRSRFQWGLLTDIGPPDLETRLAILRRNATEYASPPVPDEVLEFIARHITDNIRELEGALTRVTACAALTDQEITVDLARSELRGLIPDPATTPPTGPEIIEVTATTYGHALADLQGPSRVQPLATHRQVAMYLCRELTDLSLPKIGKVLGGRDHTTIMHGINKIKKLLAKDPELARQVSHLSGILWKR